MTKSKSCKTPRNPKYLAFVRSLPCCATGSTWEVQAAHVRIGSGAGIGMKPSDFRAVPLIASAHHDQHQHGERTFWKLTGMDPEAAIRETLFAYLRSLEPSKAMNDLLGEIIENL